MTLKIRAHLLHFLGACNMKKYLFCCLFLLFFVPFLFENVSAKSLTLEYDPTKSYNLRNMTDEEIINAEIPNYEQYFKIRDYAKNYLKTNSRYTDYCILSDGGSRYIAYMYTMNDLMFDYLPINIYENSFYDYYSVFFSLVYRQDKVYYYTSFVIDTSTGNVTSTTYANDWDSYNIGDSTTQRVGSYKTVSMNYDSLNFKMYVDTSLPIKLNTDVKVKSLKYDYVYQLELSFHDVSNDRTISYENEQQIFDENGKLILPDLRKLKMIFNSGTNAPNMGKISVEFHKDLNTSFTAKFKLQYGGNDFSPSNVPELAHYTLYGAKGSETDRKWQELNSDDFPFYVLQQDSFRLEPDGSFATVEFTFANVLTMSDYSYFKIEFYFNNTQNFYMYCFDDLEDDDSVWKDYEVFLNDYKVYDFPSKYRYAYISSPNEVNQVKIFATYNATINPDVMLKSYVYNFETKTIGMQNIAKTYIDNDYFVYYDVSFNYEDREIIILTREQNNSENTYFYVPKDYYVYFADDDGNFEFNSPDGYQSSSSDIDKYLGDDSISVNSLLSSMQNLVSSLSIHVDYFNRIFDSFFSSLPSLLRSLIIVVFILLVIFLLFGLGG